MTNPLVLVDSSVLLDVLIADSTHFARSSAALSDAIDDAGVAINPVIYAEVSVGFDEIERLEESLPPHLFPMLQIPREALFLAGKAFVRYRRGGGPRRSPLPDFFIGAHAAVLGMTLLTRDTRRLSYFPGVRLIQP
jgi:predicted nucleic acid-binding protein